MTIISAAFLLFLVMDPIGNIPPFLTTLRRVTPDRRNRIVLRELVIALLVLVFFLFYGRSLLAALKVSEPAVSIAGGIILFLIAVRMIFSISEDMFGKSPGGEPFIVPLAVPLVAGPSAMTTVILITTRSTVPESLFALIVAWVASAVVLITAASLSQYLGERVLTAARATHGDASDDGRGRNVPVRCPALLAGSSLRGRPRS